MNKQASIFLERSLLQAFVPRKSRAFKYGRKSRFRAKNVERLDCVPCCLAPHGAA